ncbi:MAG: cytochrome P450 [Chloroflexi bacterium]|nr:cytochrome P450 [Chloroflexota bacterium]
MSAAIIPTPTPQIGLKALRAIIRERSVMAALPVMRDELGDIFRVNAPGFNPVMLSGPEACRWVLVEQRDNLLWRMETDPITQLLSHGILVEDGPTHDDARRQLQPAMHKGMIESYVDAMVRCTDRVLDSWPDGSRQDLLVEVRKMALLILLDTLFDVDHRPDMPPLWNPLLKMVDFISPGLWLFWSGVPRPGYKRAIAQWDAYFAGMIAKRRAELDADPSRDDMLSLMIRSGFSEANIRDQMMTMLIAGHDTITALLAWAFHLLGQHSDVRQRCVAEIDSVLGTGTPTADSLAGLTYLRQVVDETLRLYPPAHLGSRKAALDLLFRDYVIPKGTRVVYSIFLTQRDARYWPDPNRFDPERFAPGTTIAPYTFLPFGGGKRNCIGSYFAQIEARVIIARVLQRFDLSAGPAHPHMHMGATIEPRPGVPLTVRRR